MALMTADQKFVGQSFMCLEQPSDKVQCAYVWVDGSLRNFRSKDKTWTEVPLKPEDLPLMEFCGSATDFAEGNLADFYAHPIVIYRDPFRRGNNKIIFCETYTNVGQPSFTNNRYRLKNSSIIDPKQSFTFYQSYSLHRRSDGRLLSYMDPAYEPESKSGFACGRALAESHFRACLYAGVSMTSLEPRDNRGQWRYGIGPSNTVRMCDDVWLSRYLLLRVAEDFSVVVNFETDAKIPNHCILEVDESHPDRESPRSIKQLFDKFSVKMKKPIQIHPEQPNKIAIKDLCGDIDPYVLLTKIHEIM